MVKYHCILLEKGSGDGRVKKEFWKSKGFWGAVVTVLVVAYNTIGVNHFKTPELPEFVYSLLAAFGLYARVVADSPLGLGGGGNVQDNS